MTVKTAGLKCSWSGGLNDSLSRELNGCLIGGVLQQSALGLLLSCRILNVQSVLQCVSAVGDLHIFIKSNLPAACGKYRLNIGVITNRAILIEHTKPSTGQAGGFCGGVLDMK